MKAHVSEVKKEQLQEIKQVLTNHDTFGIIDLTNLPSAQFQKIKYKLKANFQVKVYKKSLLKLAINSFKDKKQNILELEKYLENCIPALLVTKNEPFKISKLIDKNKSNMAAKPGQISPKDIQVKAGPTSFSPGPIIGELGQAGIKAAIEQGKVVIKQDVIICKEGDVITQKQAELLSKFDIKPMQIGLNLTAIYDKGQIYDKEILSIDDKQYFNNFKSAHSEAFNLAMFISYPTKETIELLVKKAEIQAIALNKLKPEDIQENPKEEQKQSENQVENTQNATKEEPKEVSQEKETEPQKEPSTNNEIPKKETTLKNPVEFTEEDSKKAQEIINQMKDQGGK